MFQSQSQGSVTWVYRVISLSLSWTCSWQDFFDGGYAHPCYHRHQYLVYIFWWYVIGANHDCFYVMISICRCYPPIESIFHANNFWPYSATLRYIWYLQSRDGTPNLGLTEHYPKSALNRYFYTASNMSPTKPVPGGTLYLYLQKIYHHGSQGSWISTDTIILCL